MKRTVHLMIAVLAATLLMVMSGFAFTGKGLNLAPSERLVDRDDIEARVDPQQPGEELTEGEVTPERIIADWHRDAQRLLIESGADVIPGCSPLNELLSVEDGEIVSTIVFDENEMEVLLSDPRLATAKWCKAKIIKTEGDFCSDEDCERFLNKYQEKRCANDSCPLKKGVYSLRTTCDEDGTGTSWFRACKITYDTPTGCSSP